MLCQKIVLNALSALMLLVVVIVIFIQNRGSIMNEVWYVCQSRKDCTYMSCPHRLKHVWTDECNCEVCSYGKIEVPNEGGCLPK